MTGRVLAFDALVRAMLREWQAGKKPPEFHGAVRAEFPNVTIEQWDSAADRAWCLLAQQVTS